MSTSAPLLAVIGPGPSGADLCRGLAKVGFSVLRLSGLEGAFSEVGARDVRALVVTSAVDVAERGFLAASFARRYPEMPRVFAWADGERAGATPRGFTAAFEGASPETSVLLSWLKAAAEAADLDEEQMMALRALSGAARTDPRPLSGGEAENLERLLRMAPGDLDEATLPMGETSDPTATALAHERSSVWLSQFATGALVDDADSASGAVDEPFNRFAEDTLVDPAAGASFASFPSALTEGPLYTDPESRVARAVEALLIESALVGRQIKPLADASGPLAAAAWARLPPPPTVLVAAEADRIADPVSALLAVEVRGEVVGDLDMLLSALARRTWDAVVVSTSVLDASSSSEADRLAHARRVVTRAAGAPVLVFGAGDLGPLEDAGVRVLPQARVGIGGMSEVLLDALRERSLIAPPSAAEDFLAFLSAPEDRALLLGTVGQVTVGEILLALHLKARTAHLGLMTLDGLAGTVEVLGGQVTWARARSGAMGDDAIAEVSRLPRGWFRVSYGARGPRAPNVVRPTPELLFDALAASD